jgi:hypothetical protein
VTREIRNQIDEVNKRLTAAEQDVILQEAVDRDPDGFTCRNKVMLTKEVVWTEQILCNHITDKNCYTVGSLKRNHNPHGTVVKSFSKTPAIIISIDSFYTFFGSHMLAQ